MNPKLKEFAEILLGNDFAALEEKLQGPNEDGLESEDVFIEFAIDKKRLSMVDWAGEYEGGETAGEIDEMLTTHWNRSLNWDAESYYRSVDAERLCRGDHPLLLFKAIDEHLKTINFRFVAFNIGADCHHFGVLPNEEFNKIDGLSWDHYNVESIDGACMTRFCGGSVLWKLARFFGRPKIYFEEIYDRLCSLNK